MLGNFLQFFGHLSTSLCYATFSAVRFSLDFIFYNSSQPLGKFYFLVVRRRIFFFVHGKRTLKTKTRGRYVMLPPDAQPNI
jgi:hypothetical protein